MSQVNIRRFLKHGMLPQLCVFEAVARLGNFTKAGEELYMAQPTVSVQMKKLTETVGTPLIEQIGKRIYLTEAGTLLYAACQELFATLRKLEGNLSHIHDVHSGRLRIAVSTTAKYFAPRLLSEFVTHFPNVEVSLQIHNRQGLLERLSQNLDDLYIFANPPTAAEHDVVTQRILPNPMVAFAPVGHPLAGRKNIPFEEFAKEPFIIREEGSGTRKVGLEIFRSHGFEPNIRMEMSTNEAIREAIMAGLGVSIMSRYTLGLNVNHDKLEILDVQGFPVEHDWMFVYPVGKQLPATAKSFMDFTRKTSKALALDYLPIPKLGKTGAEPFRNVVEAAGK
ncbi:MAG TPA: LysR substrate-binding domain-containing protein [Rhodocyclaceae bacterium]|nr:LysR substrate-binding domain-containing protein [Rhodocyclaceae bacterium]